MKIKILIAVLATLGVILPIIIVGWLLLGIFLDDGTGDTPEWKIRNLRIWKHTPSWDLALAVKQQDTAEIEKIAKTHPKLLNYQEPRFGATLLIWAVGVEKYKSAEALLKCGANPNLATTVGETALYVAAGYSWIDNDYKQDPKYVKLLLKYGANPNIYYIGGDKNSYDTTEPGNSPLMESIRCGIEKTRALVAGGADINHKTTGGMTASIFALWVGENATDEGMEYAYYLIAVKKAKVIDHYVVADRDGSNSVTCIPINDLRQWNPPLNSKGYAMKMKIIEEFARQGVKY